MRNLQVYVSVFVAVAMPIVAPRAQTSPTRDPVPGAPAGATAFINVNIIPMDTERVLLQQTVVVEGGWITAIGPSNKVTIPAGAVRIKARGQFLIPGLADMHVHLDHVALDSASLERVLPRFLAYGITTIRDMTHGSSALRNLQLKARAAAGGLLSPHLSTSGAWAPAQYIGRTGRGSAQPRLDSVAAYVAAYKAQGYDHIKPYLEQRPVFDSLLAAARRLGMPVSGHVPKPWDAAAAIDTTLSLELVLSSGAYRSIEHLMGYIGDRRSPLSNWFYLDDVAAAKLPARAAATARAGVWNTPTIALIERYRLDSAAWESGGRRIEMEGAHQIVRALHAAGAGLLLASDLAELGWTSPGVVHHELAALVRAGLTPYQAILTGTRNPAAYLNKTTESGMVGVGKRADLVLLVGNPLTDIRHTREPTGVMLGGRWLDRSTLDQFLSVPNDSNSLLGSLGVIYREGYEGMNPAMPDSRRFACYQQLQALADSLTGSRAGSAQGRALESIAGRRLAALRAELTPEQRKSFDPAVRVWLRQQARQGYHLAIPGVTPIP